MRIVASARPRALLSMSAQRFARSTQRVLQKGFAGLRLPPHRYVRHVDYVKSWRQDGRTAGNRQAIATLLATARRYGTAPPRVRVSCGYGCG